VAGIFYRRFAIPLIQLARQGVSPDLLALSLALGLCISCFPVLGTTTLLCTLIAVTWRLNLPAMLLANWIALPLQLLFLVPLIRFGGRLFPAQSLDIPPAQLLSMFAEKPLQAMQQLWTWQWRAIVAWALIAPVACVLITLVLRIPLQKMTFLAGSELAPIPSTEFAEIDD
jgi:uncharacterized protein (DUF2062 family)